MKNKKTKIIKTIKIILAVICSVHLLMFTLLFTYCSYLSNLKYTCDVDSVESVQIVKIYDINVEDPDPEIFKYRVLVEITDYEEFIERLCDIDQRRHGPPPTSMSTGDIVIKIDYTNGDFDLVGRDVQRRLRDGDMETGGVQVVFDKELFDRLINDYLEEKE